MLKTCVRYMGFILSLSLLQASIGQAADAALVESLRPKKFILSIGIGRFQSPLWHQLRFARKDAQDIYSHFKAAPSAFDGGELLIDLDQPVRNEDVLKSFEHLRQDNRNEDDTVVVYVSTHGTVAYKEDGKVGRYIITSNTDPKNIKKTSIDYDELLERFHKLKSRKKVLILAFCHSGVGKSILTPDMKRALSQLKAPYFEEPIQERSEGSIILTASGWREPAIEDERLQNDVYTHFLLDGFSRDRNSDGAVSITEAHAYAAQMTYDFTQGRQRPSAIMELLGSDPVIVSGAIRTKNKGASLFSLMDRFSKLVVSIDGKEYGSIAKGLIVPEGEVRLTVHDPDKNVVLADRVVSFQSGREYSLANYLLPRLPHSLSLGMRTYQFLDRQVSLGYAAKIRHGLNLRYVYEEAFWLYDVLAEFSYFPKQSETIEAQDLSSSPRFFTQERSMFSTLIGLSQRHKLNALSRTDRLLSTELRWVIGVNSLVLQRSIPEAAFIQRHKVVATGGLSLGAGLDTMWIYHLLRAGVDVRMDLLRNLTEVAVPLLWAPSFALHIGTFW